jgi:hypothetical protein
MQYPPAQPNLLAVVMFVVFGCLANWLQWKTVEQVNSELPEAERFSHWWWSVSKQARLWREHKRLCPHSELRLYWVVSFLLALAFMLLIVLSATVRNSTT